MQRLALQWRRQEKKVGLVPTMGYLHQGHLSLIQHARKRVGDSGLVVVSIYVNPTQFRRGEDLSRYPRDFARDEKLCALGTTDVLFFPTDLEMYPGKDRGDYSTYVVEESLGATLEGASRPTHFKGVTTVVAKLFNLVLPEVAVFGAKDFQQAAVVRRMTADLNFPIEIDVAPTQRETDGVAMSSRNAYLTRSQREQAVCLYQAVQKAQSEVANSKKPVRVRKLLATLKLQIESQPEARVDYLAIIEASTLRPVTYAHHGDQLVLAVLLGKTRLIDNARL